MANVPIHLLQSRLNMFPREGDQLNVREKDNRRCYCKLPAGLEALGVTANDSGVAGAGSKSRMRRDKAWREARQDG